MPRDPGPTVLFIAHDTRMEKLHRDVKTSLNFPRTTNFPHAVVQPRISCSQKVTIPDNMRTSDESCLKQQMHFRSLRVLAT